MRILLFLVVVFLSNQLQAHIAGDWIFRVGPALAVPNESSQDALGYGEFSINNDTQMGFTFTYMLTDNFGLEVLGGTPFTHSVSLKEPGKMAELTALPPTFMAQYYFGENNLRPYVGMGVNFSYFYDEKFTNDFDGALTAPDTETSLKLAFHAGIDYKLNRHWLLNASIWYAEINSDFLFKLNGENVAVDIDIDPFVYMLSIGYVF